MKTKATGLLIVLCLSVAGSVPAATISDTTLMPPSAKKIPHEFTLHGHTRVDPYHWLRDGENPEVTAYLEEENRHTDKVMEPVREFKGKLFDEIVARIKKTDRSVP